MGWAYLVLFHKVLETYSLHNTNIITEFCFQTAFKKKVRGQLKSLSFNDLSSGIYSELKEYGFVIYSSEVSSSSSQKYHQMIYILLTQTWN